MSSSGGAHTSSIRWWTKNTRTKTSSAVKVKAPVQLRLVGVCEDGGGPSKSSGGQSATARTESLRATPPAPPTVQTSTAARGNPALSPTPIGTTHASEAIVAVPGRLNHFV